MLVFQESPQAGKHILCWATWDLVDQWFHKLPVPCSYLPVWLHKNDLHYLWKILVPGLFSQSFSPGNICFNRFPRWLCAKPCLRAIGTECRESLRMFRSIQSIKLAEDSLSSFMRLLFWILSLVTNPWGLHTNPWEFGVSAGITQVAFWQGRVMLWFQSSRCFDCCLFPDVHFILLIPWVMLVLLCLSYLHTPFFILKMPPNDGLMNTSPSAWTKSFYFWFWFHSPVFSFWSLVIKVLAFSLTSKCSVADCIKPHGNVFTVRSAEIVDS